MSSSNNGIHSFDNFTHEISSIFANLCLTQYFALVAVLISILALYGEYRRLPTRGRFCVLTKVPTEILALEMPLIGWTLPWFVLVVLVFQSSVRIVFYGSLIHFTLLSYAMLTLYNKIHEIDILDWTIIGIDLEMLINSIYLLLKSGNLTEVCAVILAVFWIWISYGRNHIIAEEKDEAVAATQKKQRQRTTQRLRKRFSKNRLGRKKQYDTNNENEEIDIMQSSTFMR